MVTAVKQFVTPDELEAMGEVAERYELWYGELREVEGMSENHGAVGGRLHSHAGSFILRHELGEVFTSDTRFVIPTDPPSTLAPDFAFVRADRFASDELSDRYSRIVPDLVVEVVSPSNREPDVLRKVTIYLTGGVRLVWLVRPEQRTIAVFRPDRPEVLLGEDDLLDGGDVLPGFTLPVAAVFRRGGLPLR